MLAATLMSFQSTRHPQLAGPGMLAGTAPTVPLGPDGRAKILNEPARVRVVAFDRHLMRPVASTLSRSDGTWEITNLDPARYYAVVGFDDAGGVNAAIQDWVKPHVPEP